MRSLPLSRESGSESRSLSMQEGGPAFRAKGAIAGDVKMLVRPPKRERRSPELAWCWKGNEQLPQTHSSERSRRAPARRRQRLVAVECLVILDTSIRDGQPGCDMGDKFRVRGERVRALTDRASPGRSDGDSIS
jgi:hypothetical protein